MVLLMMGVHYKRDFTACRLIIMTTPSSCSSSFPLYMMRWSEAVLILLAPVHRHSLIPQNLYPSISLAICADAPFFVHGLYMCSSGNVCLVVPTNLVESWVSFRGFHPLVTQVPPTCMHLVFDVHLPFIRCSLHEVRDPPSATRGKQHLVVQPQPKEDLKNKNVVTILSCRCYGFNVAFAVHCLSIRSMLLLRDLYCCPGLFFVFLVCFILLVVTGLILLLLWLSCCHQVSVILNEYIFTLCKEAHLFDFY